MGLGEPLTLNAEPAVPQVTTLVKVRTDCSVRFRRFSTASSNLAVA